MYKTYLELASKQGRPEGVAEKEAKSSPITKSRKSSRRRKQGKEKQKQTAATVNKR